MLRKEKKTIITALPQIRSIQDQRLRLRAQAMQRLSQHERITKVIRRSSISYISEFIPIHSTPIRNQRTSPTSGKSETGSNR
jgi:hypothetical protein